MRIVALLAGFSTLCATPALAQVADADGPQIYGSVGYTAIETDAAELGAVTARVGVRANRYLGVEVEASTGVTKDDFEISIGGAGSYELSHDVAAYAVASYPLPAGFEVFGRVGYGTTKIEADVPGVTGIDGESLNYGGGVAWFVRADGLRAEWTRRDFSDDIAGEADSWSLSYVRRF